MNAVDTSLKPQPAMPNDFGGYSELQQVLLPTEHRADRTRLFVDFLVGAVRLDQGSGLPIGPGSTTDFCTFFNAFSHRKWTSLTGLDRLALRIRGRGRVKVTVATYTKTGAAWSVCNEEVELSEAGSTIHLPPLSSLPGELLGFQLGGLDTGAVLASGAWISDEPVRRYVSLAAVITTFGREAAVTRAMKTFSASTCAHPPVGDVQLYVVDNERRLQPSELEHVTIFPNPNLGGAGGFARGLQEVLDAGTFTHALFMDDDAACEPESVWRAMTLLAYMKNSDAAVAGAMLLADRPYMQHEKGGVFDRTGLTGTTWIANNHNFDMSDLARLCENEADDKVNYGAWWFFAFPLKPVKAMPFPFFVRGDDVDFCLSNDFKVVTLNGIATWCDSFGTKLGPATEYLAYRGWMALALMHGEHRAAFLALWNGLRVAEVMAFRFDYAAMNAVLDGIEDAMRGPDFFRSTPAPLAILKRLKESRPFRPPSLEEFRALEPQTFGDRRFNRQAKRTFAGHLSRPKDDQVPRHARMAWEFHRWGLADAEKSVFGNGVNLDTTSRDRKAFFAGKWRMNKILWKYRFRLAAIQTLYRDSGPAIRTRSYWSALFATNGTAEH